MEAAKSKLTKSIPSMADPMFVVAKGTQKGFIFLYEIFKASTASEKTCSMMQKQLAQKSATKLTQTCRMDPRPIRGYFSSQKASKRYPVQP